MITRHQDTDIDGDVDSNDKKYHTAFDERWRPVATFRDSDTDPKEQFLYHAAGAGGFGGSSYIDLVVLRDRDMTNGWTGAADGALEERVYYCQNWRADVVAIVGVDGAMKEWVKYSAYGVPFGMPMGDCDSDGDCDSADDTIVSGWSGVSYDVRGDTDLDGDVDATDYSAVQGGHQALGRGVLTANGVGNRKGYAGYEFDAKIGQRYHVRHRVLAAGLGRWLRRDPLEYSDSTSLFAAHLSNPLRFQDPMGTQAQGGVAGQIGNWIVETGKAVLRYGNWCGAGNNGLPPIQDGGLDKCCRRHDACDQAGASGVFEPCTSKSPAQLLCDAMLCKCARQVTPAGLDETAAQGTVIEWFCRCFNRRANPFSNYIGGSVE